MSRFVERFADNLLGSCCSGLSGWGGKRRKHYSSRATCREVIPVRLHSKNGTPRPKWLSLRCCSEVDAKDRFRFFHSSWAVSLIPPLFSPFSGEAGVNRASFNQKALTERHVSKRSDCGVLPSGAMKTEAKNRYP